MRPALMVLNKAPLTSFSSSILVNAPTIPFCSIALGMFNTLQETGDIQLLFSILLHFPNGPASIRISANTFSLTVLYVSKNGFPISSTALETSIYQFPLLFTLLENTLLLFPVSLSKKFRYTTASLTGVCKLRGISSLFCASVIVPYAGWGVTIPSGVGKVLTLEIFLISLAEVKRRASPIIK